ncbi:hypothetical protein EG68_08137 [Paragonimus skrjabini miyazakii]|uniref:SAM-dependent MTase TRM10-type domain-containing protein n=1 Tax=Paragonimus skrjabini miyazakii TaxID=59628 RepID=A0A8S9YPP2_9TREM|nr:hypothetical protein EG68_08137 [Paragonimus skrjabini miyazakii]
MVEDSVSMNFKRKCIRKQKIRKEKRRIEKLRKRAKEREKIEHMLQEGSYLDKRLLKQNIKEKIALAFRKGIKLCIDCTYESCMTPKEHNKLAQQICRAYGANRKYPSPVSLHLVNYQSDGPIAKACMDKCDGFEDYCMGKHCSSPHELFGEYKEIVYLSPDADDPLLSVSEDCVYVIGGLVDEHLMRGKSLNEANSKKCRALRLPVCEFAEKHGAAKQKNPVLAINQVVDIVLRYLNNGQNWSEALSVVPKRLLR